MIQWLLLHWIHRQGCGTPIAELEQFPAFVLSDKAEAVLSFANVAMPRT
jgi:hypothetical protein